MKLLVALLATAAALVVVSLLAGLNFRRETQRAFARLRARVPRAPVALVQQSDLEPLPAPVATWLRTAGALGRPHTQFVRLHQTGWLRTAPDKPFMPAEAQQQFSLEPPGFLWAVNVRALGVLPILGRDSFENGRGHMYITLGGLVPVVDARGPAIDQGTLLRYLGEIVWFPSAALSPHIEWTAIDEASAEATMRLAGASAKATFSFGEDGRFQGLRALRYMSDGKTAPRLEPWSIHVNAWRRFAGVEVPSAGEVTWNLEAGDFTYYRWEISQLEHEPPLP